MSRRVISAVLTLQDKSFSAGLRRANRQAGDFGRQVNVVQNKVENFKNSASKAFKEVGQASLALGAAGFAALGAGVAKTMLEMDSSFAKLQAQTGALGSDLTALEDGAKEAFSRGYGESLDEVSNAVARVKQNMHRIDNGEIANVTKNALLLANVFESDVNEVTRGANNLMDGFGITSQKAFDLFTAGGQRGVNFSNEMFDNMAEFAPLAKSMGFSAEEYFGILERGSQSGVYNLSYVNDALKEFQIMTKDGSKRTSDAMGLMSKETQGVWKSFLSGNGTIKDVATTVVGELKSMDNQVKAGQIGVELFGTKWEDLESEAMYAMLGSTDAMKNFEGATESAAASVEGSIGNRMKSVWRDLQLSIAGVVKGSGAKDFFDSVATKAEELVPVITNVVEKAFELGNTIKTHWVPIRETVIGITIAVVAFKSSMVALTVIKIVTGFVKVFTAAVKAGTVAQWAFTVASKATPFGWISAGIALVIAGAVLLYRNSDKVRQGWDTAWGGIKGATASGVNFVIEKINNLINLLNKIPGVNIPIVPKVQWGNVTAGSKEVYQASSGVNKGPQVASFAVGSNRITHDQFANIHKDEMIIPARQAQRVRAQGGNIDNIDSLVSQKQVVVTTSSAEGKTGNTFNFGNIIIQGVEGTTAAVNEFVRQVKLQLANM